MDTLAKRLDSAGQGEGQVVLLSGDAGIGKTRLAAEARRLASEQGWVSLSGSCFEPDHVLPFGPLLELLRVCLAEPDPRPFVEVFQPLAPDLIKLLPDLVRLASGVAPAPVLEPDQEKRRHFQCLTDFILGVAGDRPALICIEDLHWADEASLEFLQYFTRRLLRRPMVLLLTCRSDEAQTSLALSACLDELNRTRLMVELPLTRLDTSQVGTMIRAIFGQTEPVHPDFLEMIDAFAEGNPFFVEELLKSLVASGDIYLTVGGWTRKPLAELAIPRTLQAAVLRRMAALSEPARGLLRLAAVAGRKFDLAVLQLAAGLNEATLLPLIKELASAQLVQEDSPDEFVFRHALTHQAVLADLLARERRPLHGKFLEALEAQPSGSREGHLAEMARQAFGAEVWAAAYDYSSRAAERAEALYTPRAAVELYSLAIEAARRMDRPWPLGILRQRGQLHQSLGSFDAAQADFELGLAAARAIGDPQAEWQALLDLGFLWAARDYTETGRYFEQALTLAGRLDDSTALAHNLNRVGNWHLNLARPDEANRYHREALRIFEGRGDERGVAATLDLLGITYLVASDVRECVKCYERAMAMFETQGDRGALASSLVIYATRGADYLGELSAPVPTPLAVRLNDGQRALDIAVEMGTRPAEAMGNLWLGLALCSAGQYARGLACLQAGLQLAEAMEHRHFQTTAQMILGQLCLDAGAAAQARPHLERGLELARETGSHVWLGVVAGLLARALLSLGHLEPAGSLLDRFMAAGLPMQTIAERHLWRARAELELAQGRPADALALVDRLLAAAPNIGVYGEDAIPVLGLLRGECLLALRRYARAEQVLSGALTTAEALELKPLVWRLQAAFGRLCASTGRRDQAGHWSAVSRQNVEDLARGLAATDPGLSAALTGAVGAPPRSPRMTDLARYSGLTRREREVAGWIAGGRSNREIAEIMTLSNRTVEAHIGSILSKLGFSSRAQIAVWAVEKGLRPPA